MPEPFVLSALHEHILATLIDEAVPPSDDGRLPGAAALGLRAHVVRTAEETPMLRPVLEYGLSAIADLAAKRNPAGFASLSRAEAKAVVDEFAASDQFFLPAFLFLVYSGYYREPRVVEALGLEARAPHPEGYPMEPDDWSLLDPVRRRPRTSRSG
jgi:hypothetical protein